MFRIIAALLLLSNISYSQEFQHIYRGEGVEYIMSTVELESGALVNVGTVTSFGPGGNNILLACTNSMGEQVWTKAIGNQNFAEASDIGIDANDNFIISGHYKIIEDDNSEALVVKANPDGDIIWAKTFGGPEMEAAKSIWVMQDGSYLISAISSSYSVSGDFDMLVMKIDSDGELLWTKMIGTSGYENVLKAIELSNGNIAILGHTDNESSAQYDITITILDENGSYLWGKTYGEAGIEIAWAMMEHDGAIYFCGDTTSMGAGYADPYIVKIDLDGNILWQYTYGGPYADHGTALTVAKDGSVVLGGLTSSASAGGLDMMLLKLSKEGTLLWSKSFGGEGKEVLFDMIRTNEGGYTLAGYTKSFDADIIDIYFVKVNERGDCACNFISDCEFEQIEGTYTTSDFLTYNSVPLLTESTVEFEVSSNNFFTDQVLCAHGIATPDSQIPGPAPQIIENGTVSIAGRNSLINIYPNPSAGSVTIEITNQSDLATLVVYGMDGQVVFEDIVTNKMSHFQLNFNDLPVGIYQVKLFSEEKIISKRLILH